MATNNFSQEGQEQKILDNIPPKITDECITIKGKKYTEAEILKALWLLEEYKKNQAEVREIEDIIRKLQKIKESGCSNYEIANLAKGQEALETYKSRLLKR